MKTVNTKNTKRRRGDTGNVFGGLLSQLLLGFQSVLTPALPLPFLKDNAHLLP